MPSPKFAGLLLRLPGGASERLALDDRNLPIEAGGLKLEFEPLFQVRTRADRFGLAGSGADWFIARVSDSDANPGDAWQAAYDLMSRGSPLAAAGVPPTFVEPDFIQEWPHGRNREGAALTGGFDDQEDHGGKVPTCPKRFAWHLDDEFTQLRTARSLAAQADGGPVRIAHLDTGYDPAHSTFPGAQVDHALQRNFIDADRPNDARDPGGGGALRNPGHGAGTLSILAGTRFAFGDHGYEFDDVIGGAPNARIVPIRVGNSVVQLRTSSVAQGIAHAVDLCSDPQKRVDVISMSMGGLASAAWANAVNAAYMAGVVFVAAAGNNFGGLPTRYIVYPARFNRVVAACGVMANHASYSGLPIQIMQGCWGPEGKMATAVSAFTPNISWAEFGAANIVDMNGQGTSAATPQIAAAAALYFQAHGKTLFDRSRYPDPWMRGEAVRQALFQSARQRGERLGRGVLRAGDALAIEPVAANRLAMQTEDRAAFAFLRMLGGLGVTTSPLDEMFALEATQLSQLWDGAAPNPLELAVKDPSADLTQISRAEICAFLEALIEHPGASKALRHRAEQVYAAQCGGPSGMRQPAEPSDEPDSSKPRSKGAKTPALGAAGRQLPAGSGFAPPQPGYRPLRGYAIDPSLIASLATVNISEMTFKVPWEQLEPGPRGEYLEVVDIDPASGGYYEPVDLEDPRILVQGGLPPSEGTPQFHQQMVYAVAMITIANFEHALGRKALWRPGPSLDPARPKRDTRYVQRLRLHPHALREANAYYSPEKVALLFGYFSSAPAPDEPRSQIFTCLSHDIIAHETTHALLDGMHRRFLLASNADVRAFHEAFADIVALFQHFSFPEMVRHEIAKTGGDLRHRQSLFGNLATQFGRGRGLGGALRKAIGDIDPKTGKWAPHVPSTADYTRSQTPHERGAVLVAAVFDAFLSIYDRRTADLVRLATGGSGILGPGAIHPDLVSRLANEVTKAARHVLTMCIRALDYCPPTDILFSDYLQAILTADYDVLKDDALNYRVAFVEAFRRRGIYPPGSATLGADSLLWREPGQDYPPRPDVIRGVLKQLGHFAEKQLYARTRRDIFRTQYRMRAALHKMLAAHFESGEEGRADASFLGLEWPTNGRPPRFEVHTARIAHRAGPDGFVEPRVMLGLLQERKVPLDATHAAGSINFESGCTIVAELRTPRVLYCIRKRPDSATRVKRQRDFAALAGGSTRAMYFGAGGLLNDAGDNEPFALLHRGVR